MYSTTIAMIVSFKSLGHKAHFLLYSSDVFRNDWTNNIHLVSKTMIPSEKVTATATDYYAYIFFFSLFPEM